MEVIKLDQISCVCISKKKLEPKCEPKCCLLVVNTVCLLASSLVWLFLPLSMRYLSDSGCEEFREWDRVCSQQVVLLFWSGRGSSVL